MARVWNRWLSLADQGFSSASSILVVLVIARTSSVEDFGHFSIAYSVLVLCLGVSRSLYGTRVSMSGSPEDARMLTRALSGGVLLAAPLVMVVVLMVSMMLTGSGGMLIWAVAIAAPLTCFQDIIRFGAIASNRPGAALVSDLTWFSLIVLAFLIPAGRKDLLLALWVGAVLISAGMGLAALRMRPKFRGGFESLQEWHPVAASSAAGTLVTLGANLIVVALAAAALGAAAAGALRGASTLMGPLNVFFAYVNVALIPALIRSSRHRDLQYGGGVGAALATVACVWALLLVLLPDSWGEIALGPSWVMTNSILNFTALQYVALAVAAASTLVLKVRLQAKILLWQKLSIAGMTIVGAAMGVAIGASVVWVAAGLAAAALFAAGLGWTNVWQTRQGFQHS